MVKFVHRKDGEAWELPSNVRSLLACCDCGLVHDIVLVSHDGRPIGIAAKRNPRETRKLRAKRRAKGKR